MKSAAAHDFTDLDASGISKFHLKIMFVSGMGFFTDAYDLFIIGIVLTLLKSEWHLSAFHVALVGSTSLIAAAIGAVVFGRIADVLGRKRIYGYEVLVLAAVLSHLRSRRTSGGSSSSVSSSASASAATTP